MIDIFEGRFIKSTLTIQGGFNKNKLIGPQLRSRVVWIFKFSYHAGENFNIISFK